MIHKATVLEICHKENFSEEAPSHLSHTQETAGREGVKCVYSGHSWPRYNRGTHSELEMAHIYTAWLNRTYCMIQNDDMNQETLLMVQ